MRGCYLLLVAAIALHFSNTIVSATSNEGPSELSSYNAINPIEAAQATTTTKRFLRRYRMMDDTEDEERAANLNLIDDFAVNAGKTTLSKAKLKQLITPKELEKALADPKQTLMRQLYEGKVSLRKLAQALKANPNRANNAQVYKLYKWFREFQISRAKNGRITF